jgi:hypothetical protein
MMNTLKLVDSRIIEYMNQSKKLAQRPPSANFFDLKFINT